MSLNAQKAKSCFTERGKEKYTYFDWGNEAAVKAFNSFQESLKKEEAKLASLEAKPAGNKRSGILMEVGTNLRRIVRNWITKLSQYLVTLTTSSCPGHQPPTFLAAPRFHRNRTLATPC